MPSDSQFAISMKNQQEAEREEQRRIKSHILNLDFQDTNADGKPESLLFDPFLFPNPNLPARRSPPVPLDASTCAHHDMNQGFATPERHQHNPTLGRSQANTAAKVADKPGSNRKVERSRKLQLSDVDWYDSTEILDVDQHFPSKRRYETADAR